MQVPDASCSSKSNFLPVLPKQDLFIFGCSYDRCTDQPGDLNKALDRQAHSLLCNHKSRNPWRWEQKMQKPWQDGCKVDWSLTGKMSVQWSIADKFIDQKTEVILNTITNESDKVSMLCTTENLHLSTKLLITLWACNLVLFHSNQLALLKNPFVHWSITSLCQVIIFVEVVCRFLQLSIGKPPHRLPKFWWFLVTDRAKRGRNGCLFSHVHHSSYTHCSVR